MKPCGGRSQTVTERWNEVVTLLPTQTLHTRLTTGPLLTKGHGLMTTEPHQDLNKSSDAVLRFPNQTLSRSLTPAALWHPDHEGATSRISSTFYQINWLISSMLTDSNSDSFHRSTSANLISEGVNTWLVITGSLWRKFKLTFCPWRRRITCPCPKLLLIDYASVDQYR